MIELLITKHSYLFYIALIMVGFYGMMAKNNLMKKLIGMNIFQWSIIFYYISIGSKRGATVPIIAAHGHLAHAVQAADYINPLPHVLMLTAIVVGVATTGIALALLVILYRKYGTLEEDEIIKAIKQ